MVDESRKLTQGKGESRMMSESPIRFCWNPEQFGDGTAALRLDTNRPTWWLRDELPWMPRAALESKIQEALDEWKHVADVDCKRATSEAMARWVITVARLDGPGGVLADMQLPGPRQQFMRIDMSESALSHLLVPILTHEFGHAYGLQHFPSSPPPELMEPTLNPKITTPQATESALMVQWYGKPITQPTPAPSPAGLTCTVRLADDGKTLGCEINAEKAGYTTSLRGTKVWEPKV